MPVVVLDEQHAPVPGEDRPQFSRTPGPDRGSGRILSPVGDDGRARTRPERGVERVRQGPVVVDGNRDRAHAQCRDQIQQTAPARILDRDRVTRSEMGDQHSFDSVQRPRGGDHRPGRNTVRVEPGARQRGELRVDGRLRVHPRRACVRLGDHGEGVPQRGQQRGVGVTLPQVPHTRRGLHPHRPAGGARRPRPDPAASAPGRLDHAPLSQRAVGGRHRIGIHLQPTRQLPHGRQHLSGRQLTRTDRPLHTGGNLRCTPPTDPILS